MSHQPESPLEESGRHSGDVGSAEMVDAPVRRPNLSGDLEAMFATTPAFRRRPLGYDRLQVDNYVVWSESVLLTARQEADDLFDRYGRCWAELDVARKELAHSPEGQQMAHVTDRIGSMLQLAADEAAEITAAAAAEAERIHSQARADADVQRQKAHEFKQVALADADRLRRDAEAEADRLRRDAEADRSGAAAEREQAALDVAELLRLATEERERLDEEAAQTRARLDGEAVRVREQLDREAAERRARDAAEAAERIRQEFEAADTKLEAAEAAEAAARGRMAQVEEEVAELECRREKARASLIRLSDQVGEAVAALEQDFPVPGLRLAEPQQAAS
jgi:cell division septum initiation protein DivIVA